MRLIAFGESFVAGAGDPEHLGWIGRALAGRREVTLYNLGVRGMTSTRLAGLWRAEAEARLVADEPCRIVFSFGVNDSWGEAAPQIAPAQTLIATRSLLTDAGALCPVLMVGPPPIPDAARHARIALLNEQLKQLAARLKVPFIDVFPTLAAGGPWLEEAVAFDGAHPGAEGYRQMAEVISAHPAWRGFTRLD